MKPKTGEQKTTKQQSEIKNSNRHFAVLLILLNKLALYTCIFVKRD